MAHYSRKIKKGRGTVVVNKTIQNVTPQGTSTINEEGQTHIPAQKIILKCGSESTTFTTKNNSSVV